MKPTVVAEGEQCRYTPAGIVLMGEFSRPVTITCGNCDKALHLRLCADKIIDDNACDAAVDDYLDGIGWARYAGGDQICSECKD